MVPYEWIPLGKEDLEIRLLALLSGCLGIEVRIRIELTVLSDS